MEELQLRYGRRFAPAIADEFKRSYLIFRASLNALADHALSRACGQVPYAPEAASAWTPCNAVCTEEQSKVLSCIQR